MKKFKTAFTLAEVLITVVIIGVVAAITIPNLLADVNQRKYNSASGNFQRKLGEALNVMSSQDTLQGYTDTREFVDELSKNMKILKVCNTVTDCFPAKFKKSSGTIVETSTLTNSTALGRTYGTKTVGVQFVNGVRAIIAYNPDYTLQQTGGAVSFDKDEANKTVKMRTNVISMIFDVSDDKNNKVGEDIFQLNVSWGGIDSDVVQVGPYKIKDIGNDYTAINCSSTTNTPETLKYCDTNTNATDYWAGANKTCEDLGMILPDIDTLKAIYDEGKISGRTPRSGYYWSSDQRTATLIEYFDFSGGTKSPNGYQLGRSIQHNIMCVAN